MSEQVMTYEDGRDLIATLKAQNTRAVVIRSELQKHGFSLREIYEMQGVTPYRIAQRKQTSKAKRGDTPQGFIPDNRLTAFMVVQMLIIFATFIYFGNAISTIDKEIFRGLTNVYIGELFIFGLLGVPQLILLNLLRKGRRLGFFGLIITYILCIFGFGMYEMTDFVALNIVMLIALIFVVRPSYHQLTTIWE